LARSINFNSFDGLLTGTHDVSESHLPSAPGFFARNLADGISQHLEEQNYLTHGFGDASSDSGWSLTHSRDRRNSSVDRLLEKFIFCGFLAKPSSLTIS